MILGLSLCEKWTCTEFTTTHPNPTPTDPPVPNDENGKVGEIVATIVSLIFVLLCVFVIVKRFSKHTLSF